jgi:hypothetical protein
MTSPSGSSTFSLSSSFSQDVFLSSVFVLSSLTSFKDSDFPFSQCLEVPVFNVLLSFLTPEQAFLLSLSPSCGSELSSLSEDLSSFSEELSSLSEELSCLSEELSAFSEDFPCFSAAPFLGGNTVYRAFCQSFVSV